MESPTSKSKLSQDETENLELKSRFQPVNGMKTLPSLSSETHLYSYKSQEKSFKMKYEKLQQKRIA